MKNLQRSIQTLSLSGVCVVFGFATLELRAAESIIIPASFAVPASSVDRSKSGFNALMHQVETARPGGNNLPAPLNQLNDLIIDAATGQPAANLIDNTGATLPDEAGKWTGFVFREEAVINYNQDARDNPDAGAGNFRPDKPIPGIPGLSAAPTDNIAMRATTFLELKKGAWRMGVNSDDGFVVRSAVHPLDAAPIRLGIFDGGRGAADTLFSFEVEADGIYPFTLIWWEGNGGANVEWFAFDQVTGERILINDAANAKAVKAFRESTVNLPFVKSVSPVPGTLGVAADTNIQFVLADGSSKVVASSIQATVNGTAVTVNPTRAGAETTVVIDPPTNLPGSSQIKVSLVFM